MWHSLLLLWGWEWKCKFLGVFQLEAFPGKVFLVLLLHGYLSLISLLSSMGEGGVSIMITTYV